jgi:hypothetical protein
VLRSLSWSLHGPSRLRLRLRLARPEGEETLASEGKEELKSWLRASKSSSRCRGGKESHMVEMGNWAGPWHAGFLSEPEAEEKLV